MKQRTKIGKIKAFKAKNEKVENDINDLINTLKNLYKEIDIKLNIHYCPIQNIKNISVNPEYYADLIFGLPECFFIIKFINRSFPIDINNKNWKEIITNKEINQKTSGIENWFEITNDLKFKLLKTEFKNKDIIGFNCVVFNKQPLGKNTNKDSYLGTLDHFKYQWLVKIINSIHLKIKD
ncbi:hypothetical protein [Spiroplasma endosymbiont of Polydrusus pterygomalis]|uniref:hypothetical protein n=1 Tax=Spiroplasma endosymbiont of Polydrusus pterygomalis TaxID=3139327 RepID=UPI003CCB366B